MTYKDITALLIKLIGAVLVFWYLSWMPSAIGAAFAAPAFSQGLVLNILPAVLPLILAVLIFQFPATITNKLIDDASVSANPEALLLVQEVLLKLLGIFYIFRSVVDLVFQAAKLYFRERMIETYGGVRPLSMWSPEDAASVVSTLVELAFAIWLAVGSKGIVQFIDRMRDRG